MFARVIISLVIAVAATVMPVAAAQKDAAPAKPKVQEEQPAPIAILSIIPAQGEPETDVSLSGSGLFPGSTAFLGSVEIPAQTMEERHLSFTIPDLAPGLYALFVRRPDGVTSKVYTFTILPRRPILNELNPDTIYGCASGKEREVVLSGGNFRPNSHVVLDGAVVRGRFIDTETIVLPVPQINSGLHQVQVKNGEEAVSGTLGLMIDGRPEISNVSQGESYVNYYNLMIDGRNFQQNSVLVISEESSIDQSSSSASVDVRRLRSGASDTRERERLIYSSCNRLILQRFPYSTSPKSFRVQVVNPNGEESSPVSVSAP